MSKADLIAKYNAAQKVRRDQAIHSVNSEVKPTDYLRNIAGKKS